MRIDKNARLTSQRAVFPIPSYLKRQFKVTFNGYTYSPTNHEEVAIAARHLLDFATERYLYNSYDAFVLTVLPEYPEFGEKFENYNPLDSALATAYSEGFLHETFEELLARIHELHAPHLDCTTSTSTSTSTSTNPRLISLLQTLYEWGITHAKQFAESTGEVFARNFALYAHSPVYAFLAICDELDLPLLKWAEHEKSAFTEAFGYNSASFTATAVNTGNAAPKPKSKAKTATSAPPAPTTPAKRTLALPELDPALLESGVA